MHADHVIIMCAAVDVCMHVHVHACLCWHACVCVCVCTLVRLCVCMYYHGLMQGLHHSCVYTPPPRVLVPAVYKKDANLELHFFNNCFKDQYSRGTYENLNW